MSGSKWIVWYGHSNPLVHRGGEVRRRDGEGEEKKEVYGRYDTMRVAGLVMHGTVPTVSRNHPKRFFLVACNCSQVSSPHFPSDLGV